MAEFRMENDCDILRQKAMPDVSWVKSVKVV